MSWDGLTTLTFGSPSNGSHFFPSEAFIILRLTPNLIHCTIHLAFLPPNEPPHLGSLTLTRLKSLTVVGAAPPRAFAEALHLPALSPVYLLRGISAFQMARSQAPYLCGSSDMERS